MKLGVGRFESVSILGFNSPEWLLSNNGAIAAGGFAAGIYTTNEPPACKYIVDHCNARVVVVEGQKQLDKILAIRAELPKLAAIVVYGGDFDKSANDGVGPGTAKVYGWDEFMTLGEKISDADLQSRIDDQQPGHCCTLIYTSGTTGNPKAVMISHDNVTWTTRANLDHQPAITSGPLRVVSYNVFTLGREAGAGEAQLRAPALAAQFAGAQVDVALQQETRGRQQGRAQVGVDLKKFNASVADYGALLSPLDARGNPAPLDGGAAARFHAGRALAHEGLYQWAEALEDYEATLALAKAGNFAPDPYVVNAVGNCRASLGDWRGAREEYLESAALFQTSKGFRNGASTTQRLDGAVYASANAALAAAQLGDEAAAEREFRAVARRAPNSADARAALAALLYASGRVAEAEEQWEQACTRNVGCGKYRDMDYVARVRRWPPAMTQKLEAFLKIR